MSENFQPAVLVLVLVGWTASLCFHEFSHALVALWGGDVTVRDKGYLTCNPLRYTDPFLSLVWPLVFLLIGGIGLPGGAVYIDTSRLRSRHWNCAVSLAGPMSNALLAAVLVVPFQLGLVDLEDPSLFWGSYAFVARLQVMAFLFNLLPVPPLDGFQAMAAYLKPTTRAWFASNSHLFLLGLFVALWRVDAVAIPFWSAVNAICREIGIPLSLTWEAWDMLRPF